LDKKLVILAASLGGPPLVNEILSSLAPSFELPLLVLQQMESDFSEPLTSAWGKTSAIRLFRLEDEVDIREGVAYVIPHGTYPVFEGSGMAVSARPSALKSGNDFYKQWDMVINECVRRFRGDLILILLSDSGLKGDAINPSLKKVVKAGGTIIRCKAAHVQSEQEDEGDEDGYLQLEIDQIIAFLQKISGGKYIPV
jgi:two-component system chemotaxis response regulator CheB